MAGTCEFRESYTNLLARLYDEIETVLAQYEDGAAFSPAEYKALWQRFEALRTRLASIRNEAEPQIPSGADELASIPRRLFAEIDQLLDVEHDGGDWDIYVGAAMMHAENRIADEVHWVARSA